MRLLSTCALAIVLLVLPSVAATAPTRWPSVQDVQKVQPGIAADDAACIARFYHGRLSRSDWLAPYYSRTPAQKRTSSAGLSRCMTRKERVAMREVDFTRVMGKHAELRCVADRLEARSWSVKLAVTTRRLELRMYDRVFRACGMTGVVYANVAHQVKLELTASERRCTNRTGSLLAVYRDGKPVDMPAVAKVFDRCVTLRSEEAMWRRLMSDKVPAKALVCAAHRLSRSITFALLSTDEAATTWRGDAVLEACKAG